MKNEFLKVLYSGLESMAKELKRNDLLDRIVEIRMMTDDDYIENTGRKHLVNPDEEIDEIWRALRNPSLTVCDGSPCSGSWHLLS